MMTKSIILISTLGLLLVGVPEVLVQAMVKKSLNLHEMLLIIVLYAITTYTMTVKFIEEF